MVCKKTNKFIDITKNALKTSQIFNYIYPNSKYKTL